MLFRQDLISAGSSHIDLAITVFIRKGDPGIAQVIPDAVLDKSGI